MIKVFLFWFCLLGRLFGQLDSVPGQNGSSIVILESSSRAGAAPRVFEKPENAAGFLRRGGQRITLGLGLGLAGPTLALTPLAFSSNSETTLPLETVDALCFQGELRHGQIESPQFTDCK